jgi:hypothetical protein
MRGSLILGFKQLTWVPSSYVGSRIAAGREKV